MNAIIICLYLFLIFYNSFSSRIPLGSYADEFLCIAFLIIAMGKKLNSKKKAKIKKDNLKIIGSCFLIFIIGIISNIAFGYTTSFNLIFRDVLQTFKFFITFLSAEYVFKNSQLNVKRQLITISKILITIIFLLGVISLLTDIGMGDSIRFGFRSYRFIYSYYNYLVFYELILLCTIMTDEKPNTAYIVMGLATEAMTLRTKGFIVVAMVLFVKLIGAARKRNFSFKRIYRLRYILPIVIIIYFVSRSKVSEYLSWGVYNSIRIGSLVEGFHIMINCFPLGSGFGTYGTNLSYAGKSAIYMIYNELNYRILLDPNYGYATMSDTYWPSIYAQFGLFGMILFCYSLILCIKKIFKDSNYSNRVIPAFLIIVYLLLASFSEASFSNETGVFAPIFIFIILNMKNSYEALIDK